MKRRGHVYQRHSAYHLLSVAEKRRVVLQRWRVLELVRCPACRSQVVASQLAGHATRCPGSVAARDFAVFRGRRRP